MRIRKSLCFSIVVITHNVTEGCWEIRTTLFVRIVFFYWKTNWDCLVWGCVSLTGPDIGKSCPAPKRLQRFWWNFDGIGSRAWSTLWDGWLPPENLVGKNIGEKLFPHVKPNGRFRHIQWWFAENCTQRFALLCRILKFRPSTNDWQLPLTCKNSIFLENRPQSDHCSLF